MKNWILKVQDLGAGEILISSIDKDGLAEGADIELINEVDTPDVLEVQEIPSLDVKIVPECPGETKILFP